MTDSQDSSAGAYGRWRNVDYRPVVSSLSVDALAERLRAGDRVLEIGCGAGHNVVRLAERGVCVEAWDLNPGAIAAGCDAARQAGVDDKVRWVVGDFIGRRRRGRPVEAVVLIRVLTCVPNASDWRKLLLRVHRSLVAGGLIYIRDFLLSPETYAARYEQGRQAGWRYGAFSVPEGSGTPEFVAHHHSEDDLAVICAPYEVLRLRREQGLSANGNTAQMFEFLGRKPGSG